MRIEEFSVPADVRINSKSLILKKFPGISHYEIQSRSLDARQCPALYRYRVALYSSDEHIPVWYPPVFEKGTAHAAGRPIIAGMGPAGIFAAWILSENGYNPVILEQGRCVEKRKNDVLQSVKNGILDPVSNICFGEGGAGTFSDGKVYTRSKKPFIEYVARVLYRAGAPEEILYDSYPHIGTDKLHVILPNLRNAIVKNGGEILFEHRVKKLTVRDGILKSVICETPAGEKEFCGPLILACGQHDDRVYHMLANAGITLENKDFACGFRLEYEQHQINASVYRKFRPEYPQGELRLAFTDSETGIGLYTFCMCPGGEVVNASPVPDRVVLNGMSGSKRDGQYGNMGFVLSVRFQNSAYDTGLEFRKKIEEKCYFITGGMKAPAQPLSDLIGKQGKIFSSYRPGIVEADLSGLYPEFRPMLLKSLSYWTRKIKGFEKGMLMAPETRTSSPVRILRENMESAAVKDLFPCGEGAGYAGGIISSAVDGIRAAERLINLYRPGA